MKVAIVGSGKLGSLVAFYLTVRDSIKEIVLIDKSREKADTDATDISYIPAMIGNTKLYSGGYETTSDSDIVVIASHGDGDDNESRITAIKEIIDNVMRYNKDLIFVVASNPVDLLTYVVAKSTGLPREKIIGIGTFLDTIKYKSILAYKWGYNPIDIEAMVIGEHGDNMLALNRLINIHGIPVDLVKDIDKSVIDDSFAIVKDNSTNNFNCNLQFSPAVAVANIVEAIVNDDKHLLPVSFLQKGEYGIEDVCLSLPAVIGRQGLEGILEVELNEVEQKQLELGAALLKTEISKYERK